MGIEQQVFDCQHLRHFILTKVVHLKYKKELQTQIKALLEECFIRKWHHYCMCEICKNTREYQIANYGELL